SRNCAWPHPVAAATIPPRSMPPAPVRRVAHARQTPRSPSSHSHGSAWSINVGRPPLRDELFELGIGRFGEHHLRGDVLVAPPAVRTRHTLSFQTKHPAGIGPFRYRHRHRA